MRAFLFFLLFPFALCAQTKSDTLYVLPLKDSLYFRESNTFGMRSDTAVLEQKEDYDAPMSIDEEYAHELFIYLDGVKSMHAGQTFDVQKDTFYVQVAYFFDSVFDIENPGGPVSGTVKIISISNSEIVLGFNLRFRNFNQAWADSAYVVYRGQRAFSQQKQK
ncbi:MAG TPA: hypothetical protein VFU15_12325 [Bacteroidia bacterium]|nr:hypothetical protein [Bacteroidia bacterium]